MECESNQMHILTKEGDEMYIVFSPETKIRYGDTLCLDDILAQVVDIRFADVPGVLEHILRKSLISKTNTQQDVQKQIKDVIDSLADQKVAVAKIRGRLEDRGNGSGKAFISGIEEFNLSRANASIFVLPENQLFEALDLKFDSDSAFSKTLSVSSNNFEITPGKLGINIITGTKGSGKSYAAKRLLLKLITHGILTVVFDVNGEYLNLWRSDTKNEPNSYAPRIVVLTPQLGQSKNPYEKPLLIPLSEIDADDFAKLLGVNPETTFPTYSELLQFWNQRRGQVFDLNDLLNYVSNKQNIPTDSVRQALMSRVQTAISSRLFGPGDLVGILRKLQGLEKDNVSGGALVINLSDSKAYERFVIVEYIRRRIEVLCQQEKIKPLVLFLEEAHMYVNEENMRNILTRMRHFGIFPTFITNDPRTLPDEAYTLLDNLITFRFRNDDELRHLAKSGMLDSSTVQSLKFLRTRQCIAMGEITSGYPIFTEVQPQQGVKMGGETRKLV